MGGLAAAVRRRERDDAYPAHAIGSWRAIDGTSVHIRPIAPGDQELIRDFVRSLSSETRYLRFMAEVKELSAPTLDRLTGIDHRRDAALIATVDDAGVDRVVGVARYALNSDGESCDFAIVIADDWQGRGLGRRLLTLLVDTAATRGLKRIGGDVLAINRPMLALLKALGFGVRRSNGDRTMQRAERRLDRVCA